MSAITRLDSALKQVAPITGVSIGRLDDRSTWRVDFLPEATALQRTAAQAVVDTFDVAAVEAVEAAEAAALETLSTEARADAVFAQLATATGAEISAFVLGAFPLMSVQQRAILKLMLHVAALTLRRGGV